jgi:hypothetical protein
MAEHTKLPWRVFLNKDGTRLVGVGDKDGQGILDAGFGVWAWDDPEGIANAELVVKCVNAYPDLVRMLAKLRSIVEDEIHEYGPSDKLDRELVEEITRLIAPVGSLPHPEAKP